MAGIEINHHVLEMLEKSSIKPNKFKTKIPPSDLDKSFEALDFVPLRISRGQEKGEIRKSALLFYQYCQWYMSILDSDVVACFRNPMPGFITKPEVVDEHLVTFISWKGSKFFNIERRKGKPSLYRPEASNASLLQTYKPVREILQHLANILNTRVFKDLNRSRSQGEAQISMTNISDTMHQSTFGSSIPQSSNQNTALEPTVFDDLQPNEDSDSGSIYTEGSQDKEEVESLVGSQSHAMLSRTEVRRATLEFQEIPPRRNRKRKQNVLVLKINPERLRELIGSQSSMSATQTSTARKSDERRRSSDAFNGPASPARSFLPSPVSSTEVLTKATSGIAEVSPTASPGVRDLSRDFFLSVKTSEDATNLVEGNHEINEFWSKPPSAIWYSRNISGDPKWYEMADGLGICDNPFLSLDIQSLVADLYEEDPEMLGDLTQKFVQEKHADAVEKMDKGLKHFVTKIRPHCSAQYRKHCWRKVLQVARACPGSLYRKRSNTNDVSMNKPLPMQLETRRRGSASAERIVAVPEGLQTPTTPGSIAARNLERRSSILEHPLIFREPPTSIARLRPLSLLGKSIRPSDRYLAEMKDDNYLEFWDNASAKGSSYEDRLQDLGSPASLEGSWSFSKTSGKEDDNIQSGSTIALATLNQSVSLLKRPATQQAEIEGQKNQQTKKLKMDETSYLADRFTPHSILPSYDGERQSRRSTSCDSVPRGQETHTTTLPERLGLKVLYDGNQSNSHSRCASTPQSIGSENAPVYSSIPVAKPKRKSKKVKQPHGLLQFGHCPEEDDVYEPLHEGTIDQNTMETIFTALQDSFEDVIVAMKLSVYHPAQQGIEEKDLRIQNLIYKPTTLHSVVKDFFGQTSFRSHFLKGMKFLVEEIPVDEFVA